VLVDAHHVTHAVLDLVLAESSEIGIGRLDTSGHLLDNCLDSIELSDNLCRDVEADVGLSTNRTAAHSAVGVVGSDRDDLLADLVDQDRAVVDTGKLDGLALVEGFDGVTRFVAEVDELVHRLLELGDVGVHCGKFCRSGLQVI